MFCCCFTKKDDIKEPLIHSQAQAARGLPVVAESKVPFSPSVKKADEQTQTQWHFYDDDDKQAEYKAFNNQEYLQTISEAKKLEQRLAIKPKNKIVESLKEKGKEIDMDNDSVDSVMYRVKQHILPLRPAQTRLL
jgi:hypothetical protein